MEIKNLVRKNILSLKPYTSARSSHLSGVLLDANENGIGSVIHDTYSLQLNRYPDPSQNEIREKLGNYLNIKKENLCFGVGSDEIIDLLIRIFCEPRIDKVMILQPTYGMYKVACAINNVETINVDLNESFQIDFGNVKEKFSNEIKIIFLCSPNNPTGNLIDQNDILKLAETYNAIIAVDEAYIDFSEENSLVKKITNYKNIVVMRTFSKAWGLAGIRCGYCIADEFIINLFMNVKATYNVNKFIFHS
ncbi:MAG: aminotransferase class I/II-fold pyridoxal phosphate-dependent enzyme, partial [Melioribacteraceae bacterium]